MTLSPLSPAALNAKSLPSFDSFDAKSPPEATNNKTTNDREKSEASLTQSGLTWDEGRSSPFQSQLQIENLHCSTSQNITTATTELDLLDQQSTHTNINPAFEICEDETASMIPASIPDPQLSTSALARAMKRKTMSPVKSTRASPFALSSPNKQIITEEKMSFKNASRRSLQYLPTVSDTKPHLQRGHSSVRDDILVEVEERSMSAIAVEDNPHASTDATYAVDAQEDAAFDDTCFSTFSEVPNMDMTKFASLGRRSPVKLSGSNDQTPQQEYSNDTPGTIRNARTTRSPSPTPRAMSKGENDTTTLLLDFTQQFEAISTLSHKLRAVSRRSMSPSKSDGTATHGKPHLQSYLSSQRSPRKSMAQGTSFTPPSKNLMTLLDFELPPAPSPRSAPTISVRELESLKSNYASQISALKATLSGREAEVESLKRAVGDAERRVGESAEELREERGRRECAEKEKEEWVSRGQEFEDVLRRVKKEVLEGEKEREEVSSRAEDAEERVRELEARLTESEERVRKADVVNSELSASATAGVGDDVRGPMYTAEQVQKQIDEKVHILSTELHAIYKKKHVTKVAGLKKGFEAKTKEKTLELEALIEKLERQNEDLQAKVDGTLSGVVPGLLSIDDVNTEQREAELKQLEEQKVVIERQKAELAGREEELKTQRAEFSTVMAELERERVEKGELVAAVDEMLALQSDMSVVHAAASEPSTAPMVEEALRRSVGLGMRPSGLAKPGFGFGGPSRLAKPTASKSRMMSQIEKMGGGRVAD